MSVSKELRGDHRIVLIDNSVIALATVGNEVIWGYMTDDIDNVSCFFLPLWISEVSDLQNK